MEIAATTTCDHKKGSGPGPPAFFVDEAVEVPVLELAIARNPLAALKPVAVGLYVAVASVSVPETMVVMPTLGTPVTVCVT